MIERLVKKPHAIIWVTHTILCRVENALLNRMCCGDNYKPKIIFRSRVKVG